MKAYFIFVILLTVAYILYYAAMITRDLYGNKGNKKTDEEEFDVSGIEREEGVTVTESDKGFSVGGNEYRIQYAEPQASGNGGNAKGNVAQKLNSRVTANMEETQVTFSDPQNAAQLQKLMLEKGVSGSGTRIEIKATPVQDRL